MLNFCWSILLLLKLIFMQRFLCAWGGELYCKQYIRTRTSVCTAADIRWVRYPSWLCKVAETALLLLYYYAHTCAKKRNGFRRKGRRRKKSAFFWPFRELCQIERRERGRKTEEGEKLDVCFSDSPDWLGWLGGRKEGRKEGRKSREIFSPRSHLLEPPLPPPALIRKLFQHKNWLNRIISTLSHQNPGSIIEGI